MARILLSLVSSFCALLAPTQVAASESVPATLARTGSITCRPALDYFCRNIHVGCSGRSAIATSDFVIRVHGQQARLEPVPDEFSVRGGPLEFAHDSAIVWLPPTLGYVKITADGTYSFRHYRQSAAYMSYGACR